MASAPEILPKSWKPPAPGLPAGKAFLIALPMWLLSGLMMSQLPHGNWRETVAALAVYLGFAALFFLMLRRGKVDRYRVVFFVAYAGFFIVSFFTHLIETRGTVLVQEDTIISCQTPFCQLVLPAIIIPAALKKTIIFPGDLGVSYASISMMAILWIGVTLALGRGWCSWGCFFGGLDEGFARIPKKPRLKLQSPAWRYLPWVTLGFATVVAAIAYEPVYCTWLCPYKAVTEFKAITSFKVLVQTVFFVTLFLAFVIVLPILTGKRTQCAYFCPFAAFQSWGNRIAPFAVRVDRTRCLDCGLCVRACPTASITAESVKQGKTLITCTRCGRCLDVCPRQALHYGVRGAPTGRQRLAQHLLFLYPAYLFAAVFAAGTMAEGLERVLRLLTTGSFFS